MEAEINTLTSMRVPRGLTELITLGRTLKRRSRDILAYFNHHHTRNGPTEAINGRLEHLRGTALGLAKPHQLHHPSTPRNRRIQTPTTPPIMKSRIPSTIAIPRATMTVPITARFHSLRRHLSSPASDLSRLEKILGKNALIPDRLDRAMLTTTPGRGCAAFGESKMARWSCPDAIRATAEVASMSA